MIQTLAKHSTAVLSAPSFRVCHVVLSLDVGGLERNVINQVRYGRSLGQTVSVICLERPGMLASQVEELGGSVVCLHKQPGLRFNLIPRLRSVLRDLGPHILHTHQIPTLFYAGPAARCYGAARVVHTEHGLPLFAQRVRTRWLARFAGLHCDLFFCLTKEMATEVRKYWIVSSRRVRLIHNGIVTERYREAGDPQSLRRSLGIPAGATVIGSVGRLVEIKRYDLLIQSFARLKQHCPDAHLILIGDGPRKMELEQLVNELSVEKCVHFAGYQQNVNEYLHAMDCFALTSSSEGTPQAVLEASIARLPIVASRVGGLPEVIDDGRTGLLFPCGDQESLTQALLRLIQDKQLALRLGEAASLRVKSIYGIERMAKEYHNCYLQLTANRR